MTVRLLFIITFAMVTCGMARADDLPRPARSPYSFNRVHALDGEPELLKPPPRILPDDSPTSVPPTRILPEALPIPVAGDGLQESYGEIDPLFPNRFGSGGNKRVWGYVGGRYIGDGEKTAPNGVRYNPCMSLDLNFNFAITADRSLYGYFDTRFWAQTKRDSFLSQDGDFSSRQLDFSPGIAWNFHGRMEARLSAYSMNNLDRGNSLSNGVGSKDGAAIEGRYWFAGTDFDQGINNFVSIGYYIADDMIGNDGRVWEPAAFVKWSYNIPLWEQRLYVYTMGEFITENPYEAKWLWLDTGISCRPIPHYPMLDLRLGNECTIDIGARESLVTWYFAVRFAF